MRTRTQPRIGHHLAATLRAFGLCMCTLAWVAGGAAAARADVSGPDIVSYVNAQRAANGVPAAIVHDATLSDGCAKHAAYMRLNNEVGHDEDPAKPGYTAQGDAVANGQSVLYRGGPWTATRNPFETAPIHLHQLLTPRLNRMGAAEVQSYGCATTGSRGGPAPAAPTTYTYPRAGATAWPFAQVAAESPHPPGWFATPRIEEGTRTGPYLYVMFDAPALRASDIAWATGATLTGPGGAVSVATVDNTTPGLEGYLPTGMQVIPRAPLLPGTTYTASVSASTTTQGGIGPAQPFTKTWSFTTDSLPDTTITAGPAALVNSSAASLSFESTKPNSTFQCRRDAGGWQPCSSPYSLINLPDGPHTFAVRAIDANGNVDPSEAVRAWTSDTVAPAAVQLSSSVPASPANDNAPRITGTAEAGTTVKLYGATPCTGTVLTTGSAAALASPGLAIAVPDDSSVTLRATATDPAGNTSACSSSSVSYTEDSTAPGLATITGTDPGSPASAATPKVTGTAQPGSTVRLYATATCTGTAVATGPAAEFASPGLPVTVAANTATTLRATATDAAGNTSACSASSITYVADSIAPAPPKLSQTDPASPSTVNSPRVRGTAEAGSTVRLYGTAACSGAVLASGPASEFASPGLLITVSDGSSTTLRATATDPAANASACSSSSIGYVESSPAATPPPPPPPPPLPTTAFPPPPPLPPGNGAIDTTAPIATLSGSRSQRLIATIRIGVACPAEACRATARATVRVPRIGATKARSYALKAVAIGLRKGVTTTLRPQLSSVARTAIRRALRRGRIVTVNAAVTVADAAGNGRTLKRQIRLRR